MEGLFGDEAQGPEPTTIDDDHWHVIGEISSLTARREKVLSILPLISGTLSVLGASNIIYHILRSRRHKKNPYGRIMLGFSVCVLITTINLMIVPFLLPASTSNRVWASGTYITCSFVGFVTQFGFSACCYNGFLSLYYWLTIRHGMPPQVFAQKYEPYLHAFCILFFLVTASLGAIVGIYSESKIGLGCWIAEYPAGCEANGNCIGHYFGWILALPCMVFFIIIPLLHLSIYRFVRSTLKKNERYAHDQGSLAQRRLSQMKHLKGVAMQGSLYVASFYLSYTMFFVERVLEGIGLDANMEAKIYPILVLSAFLTPLQGFLIALTFSRPNYIMLRNAMPDKSRYFVLKYLLTQPDPSQFIRSHTSSTRVVMRNQVENSNENNVVMAENRNIEGEEEEEEKCEVSSFAHDDISGDISDLLVSELAEAGVPSFAEGSYENGDDGSHNTTKSAEFDTAASHSNDVGNRCSLRPHQEAAEVENGLVLEEP